MAILYLTIGDCIERCFPYISENLQHKESVPNYVQDIEGMKDLNSILHFASQDLLYKNFHEKAAYLFCSISQRHAFKNGNKRLAATLLRYFLSENGVKTMEVDESTWASVTRSLFPGYTWESTGMADAFYQLLYNLAFIAADGQLRPGVSFDECKNRLTILFEIIFDLPDSCKVESL